MTGTYGNNVMAVVTDGYQPVAENSEVFLQRRSLVAVSPDGRYQVFVGKKYRNLLLYDTRTDRVSLIQQDVPFKMGQKVMFVDLHTFCVDSGELVSFFDARTGEHVEFLEMQFGYREGQKSLLGFTYQAQNKSFAALYVNEEPAKVLSHKYWAALFDRRGRLLDTFRTDIDLVQSWGKIVAPRLSLSGEQLMVKSKKFSADYLLTFHTHETQLLDKASL